MPQFRDPMDHASLARAGTALIGAAALLLGPGAARAAAEPAPFESMVMICDGLGPTVTVSPGNGTFTPAFIDESHDLLIVWTISYTVYVDGVEQTAADKSHASPSPTQAITCTFDQTQHYSGHAIRLVGVADLLPEGQP